MKHELFRTLKNLKGNPRICVLTEPLWGIPYNLYIPFASVYAKAIGLTESQIGLIATIGMLCQVFTSLFGGIACDKMGRRKCTFIFDVLSWSVPVLVWMLAQNIWWFLAASILNSFWKVTDNAWNCLLVEDADPKELVPIYIWVSISGLLAVFFAPISSLLVDKLTVIPAMRILYGFTFLVMTSKFILLYRKSTETRLGYKRMEETKNTSYLTMLKQYKGVTKSLLHSTPTLLVLMLLTLMSISDLVTGTYYSIYVTEELGMPQAMLALLPMIRAGIMLVFNLGLQTFLTKLPYRPVVAGSLLLKAVGIATLILAPRNHFGWIILYTTLSAVSDGFFYPRMESLRVLFVEPNERARTQALLFVLLIAFTSPFGWLMGWLYQYIAPQIPFWITVGLICVCFMVCLFSRTLSAKNMKEAEDHTAAVFEVDTE